MGFNLMPFQDEPFNGDVYIRRKFLELKEKYGLKNAIETGSCLFGTTRWLADNFNNVYTVEINKDFQDEGLKKMEGSVNMMALLGDSVELLPTMLKFAGRDTIVFLDAHWHEHCPLLKELEIIRDSGLKPIIVIHDFVVPDNPELGFDSYQGQPFTWEWIKPIVEQIGKPIISYNSEISGAKRGVIFIEWENK